MTYVAGEPERVCVAFGDKAVWVPFIEAKLDRSRYVPSFGGFACIRPDEYDALVPLQLCDYGELSRYPALNGKRFHRPADHVVALCDDKLALTRFLTEAGFAQHVAALRAPAPPYPYVWKRRVGEWGEDCRFIASAEDEAAIDRDDADWFAQEAILERAEFATHVLRVGGRIVYASTVTYEMPRPGLIKGLHAKPLRQRLLPGCEHLVLFERILDELDYQGTACIDYKLVGGAPRIMEVNPRFGGSLCGDITRYLDTYVAALDRVVGPAATLRDAAAA